MSDAQPHTLLSSSPAPTDVSSFFAMLHSNFISTENQLFTCWLPFFQATATEDVAESLSPDDGKGLSLFVFYFSVGE